MESGKVGEGTGGYSRGGRRKGEGVPGMSGQLGGRCNLKSSLCSVHTSKLFESRLPS